MGILEFLTAAVETQPGLSELFLNLEVAKKDDKGGASTSSSVSAKVNQQVCQSFRGWGGVCCRGSAPAIYFSAILNAFHSVILITLIELLSIHKTYRSVCIL